MQLKLWAENGHSSDMNSKLKHLSKQHNIEAPWKIKPSQR